MMEFPKLQIIVEMYMKDKYKMGKKMELEKWFGLMGSCIKGFGKMT